MMQPKSDPFQPGLLLLVLCLVSLAFSPIAQAQQAMHDAEQRPLVCPPPHSESSAEQYQGLPYLELLELNSAQRRQRKQPAFSKTTVNSPSGFSELAHRGSLLLDIGRQEEGLAMLRQAQALQGGATLLAQVEFLNNLGRALAGAAEFGEAQIAFNQAATLAGQDQQWLLTARSEVNAIRAQIDNQDLAKLERRLEIAAIGIRKIKDVSQRASLQVALGDLLLRGIDELGLGASAVQDAEALLRTAIASTENSETLGYAYGFLGELKESADDLAQALDLTYMALQHAKTADSLAQVYRWEWQAAGILRQQGKPTLALHALGRAVFLLDEFGDAVIPNSPNAFANLVAPVYTEYADLLLRQAADERDLKLQQTQLHSARGLLESLKHAEVEDYFASRCLVSTADVDEMSTPGSAVIYPVLLGTRLELLVEINNRLHQFTVPVQRSEFERTVRAFRLNLERPRSGDDYREQAQQLYQWLIAPLVPELTRAAVDTLVIVPEGALRTIPMAALHDGDQFLIEQFALATTPAVQLTHNSARSKNMRFLAGGLTQGVQGFSELPNVAKEIDQLADQFQIRELRDENFVTAAISQGLASTDYSLVHLATHGEFKADYKESFILTFDDRLTLGGLQSILRTRAGAPLDLLVLSACQTAAGDDRAALGLAGVAVQSGARSALASLWSISDASTADLFAIFYEQLRTAGKSKAQSLRQAQRALLQRPEYQHPSYWAPFLLIGDWT